MSERQQSHFSDETTRNLEELAAENSRLKRLLAELLIKNQQLRESYQVALRSLPTPSPLM